MCASLLKKSLFVHNESLEKELYFSVKENATVLAIFYI